MRSELTYAHLLAGREELMRYFVHPEPSRRVLLAGTYNAHPVPTAAAIATIERLRLDGGAVYGQLERLGQLAEQGIGEALARHDIPAILSRQGSAFCVYYMDHLPVDWHDIARCHDFSLDEEIRRSWIAEGVYVFPLATKQLSISAAHTEEDIAATVESRDHVLCSYMKAGVIGK